MAKTIVSAGKLNPVSSSRTGGIIPSDVGPIVDIGEWVRELEPRQTPISTRIGYGGSVSQLKHEIGQSYHTPVSGTLAGSVANNDTTVSLTSGQGKYLQQYNVIEVIDYFSGTTRLDYSTREEMIVTTKFSSGATDTPAVIRDVKNRTDSATPASGSWPTHASGAYWAIVGVAMPYNTDFDFSPVTSGDRIFNYPQRFWGAIGGDMVVSGTPTYENPTDRLAYELTKETKKQKWYLERTVVSGVRMEGDGSTLPYKMGGMDYFIQTYGNNVNLTGLTIKAYDLEDLLRDQFKKLDDGGAKTMIMGPDTAAIFDSLLNPVREATVQDSSVNLMVSSLKFRWGTLEIQPTQHLPEGTILFVDFGKCKIRPYKGLDWQVKNLETQGASTKKAIFGDFTLEMQGLARFGRISNFNTDLSMYPRKTFF